MHDDFYPIKNGYTMVVRWVLTLSDVENKVKGSLRGTEREGIRQHPGQLYENEHCCCDKATGLIKWRKCLTDRRCMCLR